ncbi:hypothetical protein GALMADRAFT_782550 [Galerina marginata CBS 339.88]|uniref:Uncharacterized protein n=1 Tax=Galerina marginata (strain CBS 339.88) TaxID=685588 RepID=A0A067SLN3_GALM3|nr:hypothetical protein GALMADRAFT_782550 [Galerina marginata CBS 339.88]
MLSYSRETVRFFQDMVILFIHDLYTTNIGKNDGTTGYRRTQVRNCTMLLRLRVSLAVDGVRPRFGLCSCRAAPPVSVSRIGEYLRECIACFYVCFARVEERIENREKARGVVGCDGEAAGGCKAKTYRYFDDCSLISCPLCLVL